MSKCLAILNINLYLAFLMINASILMVHLKDTKKQKQKQKDENRHKEAMASWTYYQPRLVNSSLSNP